MDDREILPQALRFRGLQVPQLGLMAWDRQGAIEVLRALSGTTIAIVGVTACRELAWGLVPEGEAWHGHYLPGEFATDFAARTRTEALAWIETHDEASGGFYALDFSRQDDAA